MLPKQKHARKFHFVALWQKRTVEREQQIRMVVGPATVVVKMDGTRGTVADLTAGMVVNAILSTQATRSLPPQSEAFLVEIVKGGEENSTTVGRIVDIDRMGRNFTTISDGNFASIIRFNVLPNLLVCLEPAAWANDITVLCWDHFTTVLSVIQYFSPLSV